MLYHLISQQVYVVKVMVLSVLETKEVSFKEDQRLGLRITAKCREHDPLPQVLTLKSMSFLFTFQKE